MCLFQPIANTFILLILLQVVAVAGGANITLWDAYSGTFLGILGSFSNEMGIPGEINPAEGLQVDPKSARAVSCPSGQLPPLGTEFVDMIPPEDTTIGSKVNTAANVASSVASTFAKKCDSCLKLKFKWLCGSSVLISCLDSLLRRNCSTVLALNVEFPCKNCWVYKVYFSGV